MSLEHSLKIPNKEITPIWFKKLHIPISKAFNVHIFIYLAFINSYECPKALVKFYVQMLSPPPKPP